MKYAMPALAVLALGGVYLTWSGNLALHGDNAEYLVLGESLATGQGLSYISSPNPEPSTKYPPLFPMLLSGVYLVIGPTSYIAAAKILVCLFAVSAVLLTGLVAHYADRPLAVTTISGLFVLAWGHSTHMGGPLFLDYAHQVMAEVPYATLSLVALLGFMLRERSRWGGPLVVVGLAGAVLIRTVGAVLCLAVVIELLMLRRYRVAGWTLLAGIIPLGAWSVYTYQLGSKSTYLHQLLARNAYYPERGGAALGDILQRMTGNASYYTEQLASLVWPWSSGEFALWVGLLTLPLVGWAFLRAWDTRLRVLVLSLLLYVGVILLWPWKSDRFLVPLVPVLAIVLADGAVHAARRYSVSLRLLALGAYLLCWGPSFASAIDKPLPSQWALYQGAGLWLRENTPEDALITARKPLWLYVVSRRRTIGYPFVGPDSLLRWIDSRGVDYVVVDILSFPQTRQYIVPAILAYPDRFTAIITVSLRPDVPGLQTTVLGVKRN